MALVRGEVNPLGSLNLRKLEVIPAHFSVISVEILSDINKINHWINYNLNSRYAIKKKKSLDRNNTIIEVIEIGIEDPTELTMLILGCPHIHKKKEV
jgi:hypothetical protein